MKHTGGCHCQKVRFEVEVDTKQVIDCNCSMCFKKGHLMAFAPVENFKLISGEDSLNDYKFNKQVIHHLFCSNCGIASFGKGTSPDGKKVVSINVRCLDNFDLSSTKIVPFDGKSI